MGMFDTVTVSDRRFCCSEGHDLSSETFQTKDLGECMLDWRITSGVLVPPDESEKGWGILPPLPFSGAIHIYTDCSECPAFVQAKTMNMCGCSVAFDVMIDKNQVVYILRVSQDTKDFLIQEPKLSWMEGCHGPMSYDEALKLHRSRYNKF